MLPEEDRPPAWLRDYGDIEADISKMEEFAAKLDAEVRENYAPHAQSVYEDMQHRIPAPYEGFVELTTFLMDHDAAEAFTRDMVYDYQNRTGQFASAAKQISSSYSETDAFSAARVRDVQAAFSDAASKASHGTGTDVPTTHGTATNAPEVP